MIPQFSQYSPPKPLIADRDPTPKDGDEESDVIWISTEYFPYRVFRGTNGNWKFLGKFYPVEK